MDYESYPQNLLENILTESREYPIGSRHANSHQTYTVVALRVEVGNAIPVLLGDDDLTNGNSEFLLPQEVSQPLTPVHDGAETATRAREAARQAREFITQYGNNDVLWANPTTTGQIDNVIRFGDADRDWRIAQNAQMKAAEERALAIARVAWDADNQSEAARLLGLDQSRVSRAVEAAHRLTGGDTT